LLTQTFSKGILFLLTGGHYVDATLLITHCEELSISLHSEVYSAYVNLIKALGNSKHIAVKDETIVSERQSSGFRVIERESEALSKEKFDIYKTQILKKAASMHSEV
jgi:hypothetical protein